MGATMVKLIIEAENRVKAQLAAVQKQLQQMQKASLEASNAMKKINTSGINGASKNTSQFNTELLKTVTTIKNTGNALNNLSIKAKNSFSSMGSSVQNSFSNLRGKIQGVQQSLSRMGDAGRIAGEKINQGARAGGGGLNFLRTAASMTVGMIGYDLVNNIAMSARESINAAGNFQSFGRRMNMTSSEIAAFSQHCNDLQSSFRKVDMKAVGAAALELGVKLKLPKSSMDELTKTTAVMSSAFIREGRTQTDSILAVSDALDGQFRRLQEIGISQEMLKNNGWDGDISNKTGLLQAMNKTLDEMGYSETAMHVNTLDEAWQMLSVSGGQLLASILIPLTPALVQISSAFVGVVDGVKGFIGNLQSAWNLLPDWVQESGKIGVFMGAILLLSSAIIIHLVPAITGGLMSALVSFGSMVGVTIIPELATLSGAFMTVASAAWAAVAPFLPFIAAAAALAVVIYEVGKSFGWWTDVSTMIDAIRNNIGRLWDAFINHPDVQALLKAVGDAFKYISDLVAPVTKALGDWWTKAFPPGQIDITRMLIDSIGWALERLIAPVKIVITAFKALFLALTGDSKNAGKAIQETATIIMDEFLGLAPALLSSIPGMFIRLGASIVEAVLGAMGIHSPGIIQEKIVEEFFSTIQRILGLVSEAISAAIAFGEAIVKGVIDTISGIGEKVMGIFSPIIGALAPISEYIVGVFAPAWNIVIEIFDLVWTNAMNLITAFSQLLTGQISLQQAIGTIWGSISTTFMQIVNLIISTAVSFAAQLYQNAVRAGSNFVNGIISFVGQLPGRVYAFIMQTSGRILAGASVWVSNAKTKAVSMVNGVIATVSRLPGKVYNEFMNIGSRIMQAGSDLVNKAKKVGQNIVNGMLNAMGIHSPGIIQEKVVLEFVNMLSRVKNKGNEAYTTGKKVGESIVDGFGTVDLGDALGKVQGNLPLPANIEAPQVMDNGESGTNETGEEYGLLSEDVTSAVESISLSNGLISDSFSTMTASIGLSAGTIQMRVAGVANSFNTTRLRVSTALSSMAIQNTTAWGNISTVTQTNLDHMQNTTLNATQQMTTAWNMMKDNIVNAANNLKSQSSQHFNQLSSTIGTFYVKLQNPSRWGGSPNEGSIGKVSTSNRFTRGLSAMGKVAGKTVGRFAGGLNKRLPSNMNLKNLLKEIGVSTKNYGNEALNRTVNVRDFLSNIGGVFGSWSDWTPGNYNHIKTKSDEWRMKGPALMGHIDTGLAFQVKEFENGRPTVSFDSFRRMGEALFSAIPYDFYMNSDKTGDWVSALATGSVNCWDGNHALLALANTCGFRGHIEHGTWNGFPHVFAVINGRKMDSTGWQLRRNWNGVASGPAPRKSYYNGLIHNNNTDGSEAKIIYNNDEVHLILDHNIVIHVEGDNVDEKSIIDTLKTIITDSKLINRIAEALIKRDNKMKRMGV